MKKNPDAELFAMRDRCAELWEQTMSLDKRTIDLRRAGKLSGADELQRRHDRAVREACGLEWTIIRTDAHTPKGHAAKVKLVVGSGFDPEDLIEIAWILGHEAARVGLGAEMPALMPSRLEATAA